VGGNTVEDELNNLEKFEKAIAKAKQNSSVDQVKADF